MKFKKNIILLLSVALPFLIAFLNLIKGNITLWYDPARDLLLAWDNLHKLTLIGPTSGIPGIFYGPYWIWLLSLGELVSKDPRVVTAVVAMIPYMILFPIIWFKFSNFFSRGALIAGWLLFILSSGMTYATQLWNPYPAPLITLSIIFLLLKINFNTLSRPTLLRVLLQGFLLGLLINFHISFGVAILVGTGLFLIVEFIKDLVQEKQKRGKILAVKLILFCTLGIGIVTAFIPFLLFELRHGFNQIRVMVEALSAYGAVVGVTGLTKGEIFQEFFKTFAKLTYTTPLIAQVFLGSSLMYYILQIKRGKTKVDENDKKIITLILSLFAGISFLYFSARNPVWAYHFIGVDILFLFVLVFLATKISIIKKMFFVLAIYALIMSVYSLANNLYTRYPSALSQLTEKVQVITKDAKDDNYVVIADSSAIYIYEYSYVFRWLANKDVPYDPGNNPANVGVVYLVVPKNSLSHKESFINYRTPKKNYTTAKTWKTSDESLILKRIKAN